MQQRSASLLREIIAVIVWCVATPVLTIWAMMSFLPIVSVISAWGDLSSILIALVFLGTSAVGLLSAFAGYRLLSWEYAGALVTPPETRTMRVLLLTVYALLWMLLYGLYSMD